MRSANLAGRLVLVADDGQRALDVQQASQGRFDCDPQAIYDHWDDFRAWAATVAMDQAEPFDPAALEAPVPWPRQIFAIGLNYAANQAESAFETGDILPVFTKFATSLTGPYASVAHPGGQVDWEVELVVVIGRLARRVTADQAWDYVAGLTAGQDLSERILQTAGAVPQFSLGKSYPGFAPTGPWLVTLDQFPNPGDLAVETWVNGEPVQKARTSQMICSVPRLIEWLSGVTALLPGDIIFTGTPAGVGEWQDPPRFLQVGDVIVTKIEGIGQLRNTMVAGDAVAAPARQAVTAT